MKKGIDIKGFARLQAFLKGNSSGHLPKKAATFTRLEIERFLRDAVDDSWLHIKVAACVSVFGACRKSELLALAPSDLTDLGAHVVINIRQSKTDPRSFMLVGNPDPKVDAVLLLRKYLSLRQQNAPNRLLIGFRNGKCTNQPIGINTLATYACKIAEFLELKDQKTFTSHAFRRSAATWVADSGVDIVNLKRFGGWRSDTVAQGYVANSVSVKQKLAVAVQGISDKQAEQVYEAQSREPSMPLTITGCQNWEFHININSKQ